MKVELEVTTLVLGFAIAAKAGDQLMVYNGQVIGLLPKGASPVEAQAALSITPASVYEVIRQMWRDGINARTLGAKLGLDGDGKAQLANILRRQMADGSIVKHPDDVTLRYPRYIVYTALVSPLSPKAAEPGDV